MTLQYYPVEYWAKVDAKLATMGLPELVDTYESQVCETRRLAGLAPLPDDLLSQQEHHAVYARKALEELRRHGLPESVYRRCCRTWQYSDADWADTQRQIESWASKPEPAAVAAGTVVPKRKSSGRYGKTELTDRQAEAVELLGIHKTKTKAAVAMGKSRATFDKHHNAAMRKLGKLAVKKKPKTEQYVLDHRGQANVSRDHRND